MPIPEAQLETWSHLGAVAQSAQTYETIRTVLNDGDSPYYDKSFSVFLQGSYGNDTNVYKDSDVDVVIRLDQTYYSDTTALTPAAKANYDRVFSLAKYQHKDFKADVLAWLEKQFGSSVKQGRKAIHIPGSGARRDADVLVCAQHRLYRESSNGTDLDYVEGVIFWTRDGTEIVNFPKQHSENCTAKHWETDEWFKPVVRIYKNMRNRMIGDAVIGNGVAPSYFIEGMLWSVPASKFGTSYEDSFVNTFNWILEADKTKLSCANDLHWLVRDDVPECWSSADFDAYLAAVSRYWGEWRS